MVTTWLTPHEARTLAEMASARYTTTADTVRQAVKKLLRETRYHGPGHTREQLHEMMAKSPLSIILDPDALWDQSNLDETTKWPTDAAGNDLIDEVNFAVGNDPSIPYMNATFNQDQPSHRTTGADTCHHGPDTSESWATYRKMCTRTKRSRKHAKHYTKRTRNGTAPTPDNDRKPAPKRRQHQIPTS